MINNYFQELDKSLAGVFPENIINYDEANLSDDPGRCRLIFKWGARYPERIINGTKASTSLMLAGTAAEHVLPVYVVYKSDNLWSIWTEGGPPRARYNEPNPADSKMLLLLTGLRQSLYPIAQSWKQAARKF